MCLSRICVLDVTLRWAELNSTFCSTKPWEKKTPKKFLLRSLRKTYRRPACMSYENQYPWCWYEMGNHPYRRESEYGTATPRFHEVPGETKKNPHGYVRPSDGLKGGRPKAPRSRKPDLRDCTIVEVDDRGREVDPEVIEPVSRKETPDYYKPASKSREYKRSVRNDEYLRGKIRELRGHVKSVRASASADRRAADVLKSQVSNLEAGIRNLTSQFSGIDLNDSTYYGGYQYPPPDYQSAGSSGGRMNPPYRRGRVGGLRPPYGFSSAFDRQTGGGLFRCTRCHAVNSIASCPNGCTFRV